MNPSLSRVIEAERLLTAGLFNDAANVAVGILADSPHVALALNVLGIVAAKSGNTEQAMTLWDTATRAGPTVPQPWVSLGEALFALGKPSEAAAAFGEALARKPDMGDVWINRGIALQTAERHEEALESLRRGLALVPGHIEAAIALATSLHGLARTDQAIETLKAAGARSPSNAKVWGNLGVLFEKSTRLEDAVECYDRALAIDPHDAKMLFNRGSSLIQLLRIHDARRDWEASARLSPQDANTINNLAILELLDGHLQRGFELFEARWGVRHHKFPIPAPEWDGSSLDGKHLLLYVEQGLGDMLQFCRYVPILKRRYRCRISMCALPTLHGLLRSLEGLDGVVDIRPPYPACDVQCSLLSVPFKLKTTMESIPHEVPYLRPDPERARAWTRIVGDGQRRKRVGLFWQGTQVDPNRTIKLAELSALWSVPGIDFFSLQKGPGEEELNGFPHPIKHVGSQLLDFADTAALLSQLDLLITIDTSIAHAAGALGRPVWTFIPHRPDWRWLLQREDSPWYPTMRLYRQTERKRWGSAIASVATDLSKWATSLS